MEKTPDLILMLGELRGDTKATVAAINTLNERINDLQSKIEDRLETREHRLDKRFASMETRVASLEHFRVKAAAVVLVASIFIQTMDFGPLARIFTGS